MTSRERAEKLVDRTYPCGCPLCIDHKRALADEFDAIRAEARREALEEAASLFETWLCLDHGGEEQERIQDAIRALKEKTP